MKKLRTAAAAALAVVFAVGAWAQAAGDYVNGAFEVSAGNNGHTYALEEIVGTGKVSGYPTYSAAPAAGDVPTAASAIEALLGFGANDGMRPYVILEARSADAAMAADSKGLITFALGGAKFATSVRNSDLVAIAGQTDAQTATGFNTVAAEAAATFAVLRRSEGGAAGDSSVTFEVQIATGGSFGEARTDSDSSADTPSLGDMFVLKLPALDGVSAGGVTVSVSTDSITTNFPVVDMVERKVMKDGALVDDDVAISTRVIPRAADAVMLSMSPEMSYADIDVEGRMQLVTGGTPPKMTSLIEVGTVSVMLTPGVLQSNGKAFGFDAGGAGHAVVTVYGVGDTDMVFLDTVANRGGPVMDTGEELAVSGGMATNDFSLSGLPSSAKLYVMVDGKRTLSPGTIKATASVSFRSGIADLMWLAAPPWVGVAEPGMATVQVRYAGTDGMLPRAYAIAPMSSGDTSNVRVRCDDSSDCQIFLACTDTAGNDVFGKVSAMIPARATMTLRDGGGGSAMDLREVFGEDAWMEGRLACDVIAPDRNVEVQVLTRSEGVLVNNTYVSGG
ncbi:MAG: hypothetical protein OXH15_22975 [Gammaproteobacteria bacterium]|nr:hypothetical protein [Gammaproteobacteria bacterium]